MPVNLKELIVVLALSALVFALGRNTALRFMQEGDFRRRRNVWLFLTTVAFLSPNCWVFTLFAIPTLYWAGKKDANPIALYLLLMNVIPSVGIQIPTGGLGINQLFEVDIFRLLSFCVLVPAALRIRKSNDPARIRGFKGMDLLLMAYGIMQVAFYVPPDLPNHVILHSSATNVVRESFLFLIDMYVVYYVASRSPCTRGVIVDAMAAFCLACLVMASTAIFESMKHWLLYTDLYHRWGGDPMPEQYLFRAGLLRAESSSGNSIVLGFLLAIGFGFWLYLKGHVERRSTRVAVTAVLWLGLLVSMSRGPWLGALLIYFYNAAIRPRGATHLFRSAILISVVGGLVLVSPLGDKITNSLPFLSSGKVPASSLNSLDYRERLVLRSWQLILEHPLLGDQDALSHMQNLRQGQGIIDIVNTYVGLTLFHGFLTLAIFLLFILTALFRAQRAARAPPVDSDLTPLGAALAASIVGMLLMLADCGFFLGIVPVFFALAGLAVTYSRLKPLLADGGTIAAAVPSPGLP